LHEAVLDLSITECGECEEVGYIEVEGNQEDSPAKCFACGWTGYLDEILDDDADVAWDEAWNVDVIRSQPKPEPPRTPPTCAACGKAVPTRKSVLKGEWCVCKNSPGSTETSPEERQRWRRKNGAGLCSEDRTKYVGANLNVEEMQRLLKDADKAAQLLTAFGDKADMIVNAVLGELFDRKPFKHDLRDMRDNHKELWDEMWDSMCAEVLNILEKVKM
jgi:hypothetical protein